MRSTILALLLLLIATHVEAITIKPEWVFVERLPGDSECDYVLHYREPYTVRTPSYYTGGAVVPPPPGNEYPGVQNLCYTDMPPVWCDTSTTTNSAQECYSCAFESWAYETLYRDIFIPFDECHTCHVVPEPGTLCLVGLGILGIGTTRRLKRWHSRKSS